LFALKKLTSVILGGAFMKNKGKLLLSLLAVAVLAACALEVRGLFKAHTSLEFLQKGFLGRVKKVVVAPGAYNSLISLDGRNNVAKLTIYGANREKTTVSFKAPLENIPLNGSWVTVPASQTGQHYDLRLAAKRNIVKEDELRREWESCTYQRCHTRCTGTGENRECHQECTTYHGEQRVEYYFVHTYWDIKFKLGRSGNFSHAGYEGNRHDVAKDYTYRGSCR
jgi:hypothetical protein